MADSELLAYLNAAYQADLSLTVSEVQTILARTSSAAFPWTEKTEDGLPPLHLACLNEGTPSLELFKVISLLLQHGAPPNQKDEDEDTAFMAVLQSAEDAEDDQDEDDKLTLLATHVAALTALLRCQSLAVGTQEVSAITSWLRRKAVPENVRKQVLSELTQKIGAEKVQTAWASEELMTYLEHCCYEGNCGLKASKVQAFIQSGAPVRTEDSSSSRGMKKAQALLLVVLNPYCSLEELEEVFRLILSADPLAAADRDGFKLSPMNWAADYANVCSQHGMKMLNPATLLGLMPAVAAYCPPDVDAGETCLKVSDKGTTVGKPPAKCRVPADQLRLRFLEGDRVVCRVPAPGGATCWEEGVVIGTWYRESCWPDTHPGAPYEVKLDLGSHYFALIDHDRIVRPEAKHAPKGTAVTAKLAYKKGNSSAPAGNAGARFQKRESTNGWELLDTVSGKARPCSPPDSDDED